MNDMMLDAIAIANRTGGSVGWCCRTDREVILDYIAENPGCTSRQIQEATGFEKGPLTGHLWNMANRGLVARSDKRPMKYSPTTA